MAAKMNEQKAKAVVIEKIAAAFGENYLGEHDKRFYINVNAGGENVQVAITLTCPKVPIQVGTPISHDFSAETVEEPVKKEISVDERKNLEMLMARLGI